MYVGLIEECGSNSYVGVRGVSNGRGYFCTRLYCENVGDGK